MSELKNWIKLWPRSLRKAHGSRVNNTSNNRIFSNRIPPSVLCGGHIRIMHDSYVSADSKIGGYTYVGNRVAITRSEIGRYVSIADNVTIGAGEHLIEGISTSAVFYKNPYEILTQGSCCVGNDVWIGVDSIIQRGISVGDGAIIGANSTVTHNVPDFAIVVGSPARILRYRFSETKIDLIRRSLWWSLEFEEASKVISELEAKCVLDKIN